MGGVIYDNEGTANGAIVQKEIALSGSGRIGVYRVQEDSYTYELADHLGNVRAVISRIKVNGKADVLEYADYYAMGGVARSGGIKQYRYGYQGQYAEYDKATEWNEFELRMYDPMIGRWLSPDPYGQYNSPYEAMGNDWANQIDPDGGWSGGGIFGRWVEKTVTIAATTRDVAYTATQLVWQASNFTQALGAISAIGTSIRNAGQLTQGNPNIIIAPNSHNNEIQPGNFRASDELKQFIKSKESLRLKMYDNDGSKTGNATIGYGHLIHEGPINGAKSEEPFKKGITETKANELLEKDIERFENLINQRITRPINQKTVDVLIDLYWTGQGNKVIKANSLIENINAAASSQQAGERVIDALRQSFPGISRNAPKLAGGNLKRNLHLILVQFAGVYQLGY